MEHKDLSGIESSAVDEVVVNAMALLVDGEHCEVVPDMPPGPADVIVAVYCGDQQQNAVVLRCEPGLARRLAGRVLELEPDEIADADVVDATSELVNVIAGNLRGLVTSPGAMTTPFVLDDVAYARFPAGAHNCYRIMEGEMQVSRV